MPLLKLRWCHKHVVFENNNKIDSFPPFPIVELQRSFSLIVTTQCSMVKIASSLYGARWIARDIVFQSHGWTCKLSICVSHRDYIGFHHSLHWVFKYDTSNFYFLPSPCYYADVYILWPESRTTINFSFCSTWRLLLLRCSHYHHFGQNKEQTVVSTRVSTSRHPQTSTCQIVSFYVINDWESDMNYW